MNSIYPWQKFLWNDLVKNFSKNQKYTIMHGVRGIGKSDFARILSKYILCNSQKLEPCNTCDSCRLFYSSTHICFLHVVSKPKLELTLFNKIQDFLRNTKAYKRNEKKVILIQEAHLLNVVHLKLLTNILESDEFTNNISIILTTNSSVRIPENIIRKSKIIKFFSNMSKEKIIWIEKKIGKESDIMLLMKITNNAPLTVVKYHNLNYLKIRNKILNHIIAYKKLELRTYKEENLSPIDLTLVIDIFSILVSDLIKIQAKTPLHNILNFDVLPLLCFISKNSSVKKLHNFFNFLQNLSIQMQNGIYFDKIELYKNCLTGCINTIRKD